MKVIINNFKSVEISPIVSCVEFEKELDGLHIDGL